MSLSAFRPSHFPLRSAVLAAIIAICVGAAPAPVPAGEPLTDEDVVVMYVSGQSVASIIDRIRNSPTEFDLSDEMLGELRAAGLPSELLQAMIDRQRERDGEAETGTGPEDEEETDASPTLSVRIDAGRQPAPGQPRPAIRILDTVDAAIREQLRMRTDDPRFTDIAIVLLCTTQDHVPDQWRSQTPLGRDFVNTPRHRLLAFISGAEREEPGKLDQAGHLALEIPEQIEARIEIGVVHDLILGVALQAEGRFYLVAADGPEEIVAAPDGLTLHASIEGHENGTLSSLIVRWSASRDEED